MKLMTMLAAMTAALFGIASAQQMALGSLAEKMDVFDWMHGEWRGTATTYMQTGETVVTTQTERVGPFLQGDVVVVEGRSYDDEGKTVFNAFGTISFDPFTGKYEFRAYTGGYSGTYEMTVTDNGYEWSLDAGPGKVEYKAVFDGETWLETGEYVIGDQRYPTFRMELTRLGDSDWPAAGEVGPN